MKASDLIQRICENRLSGYEHLYADTAAQCERYLSAVRAFIDLYGDREGVCLLSVPGRSEISGNHTDHNHGRVLAGAIDRDIIAVAAPAEEPMICFKSEGYPEDRVDLSKTDDPDAFPRYTSEALIAGVADGLRKRGGQVGGFCAYTTTQVLKGSGISSSAAFEVMVGNIFNHLYNGGRLENQELAKIAQYAENVYFGKPCGLMDQMACAVGGFVAIDFEDPGNPVLEPIDFSLTDAGYVLVIVNTGGNHADLNADYASVPAEMKQVAAFFGKQVLRGITMEQLIASIPALRPVTGDRAILRAIHFIEENERVKNQTAALRAQDVSAFLKGVLASGNSSFRYLQNVYTTINVREQGLSLALALTELFLDGKECAWRVHGGGFAGTIQAFVKEELAQQYCRQMDAVFGEGAAMVLRIRREGAVRIQL